MEAPVPFIRIVPAEDAGTGAGAAAASGKKGAKGKAEAGGARLALNEEACDLLRKIRGDVAVRPHPHTHRE
jgi:hypothetical protein